MAAHLLKFNLSIFFLEKQLHHFVLLWKNQIEQLCMFGDVAALDQLAFNCCGSCQLV